MIRSFTTVKFLALKALRLAQVGLLARANAYRPPGKIESKPNGNAPKNDDGHH